MLCFQLPGHLSDSKSVGHFHLLKYFIHRLLEREESLPRGPFIHRLPGRKAIKVSWEENGGFFSFVKFPKSRDIWSFLFHFQYLNIILNIILM